MCSSHLYTLVLARFSSTESHLWSTNEHEFPSIHVFFHVTTWKSQFILFSPLLKKCLVLTDVGEEKKKR